VNEIVAGSELILMTISSERAITGVSLTGITVKTKLCCAVRPCWSVTVREIELKPFMFGSGVSTREQLGAWPVSEMLVAFTKASLLEAMLSEFPVNTRRYRG
jgi:hypothetical protein